MGGLLGSKDPGPTRTSTTTSRNEDHSYNDKSFGTNTARPWDPAIPYLTGLFGAGKQLFDQGRNIPYIENPNLQQFMSQSRQPINPNIAGLLDRVIANDGTNRPGRGTPEQLQDYINTQLNPVFDKYKKEILPGLETNAAQSNRWGSVNHEAAVQEAMANLGKEVANVSTGIAYDDYQRQQALDYDYLNRSTDNALRGAGLFDNIINSQLNRTGAGLDAYGKYGYDPQRQHDNQIKNQFAFRQLFEGLPISTDTTNEKSGTRSIRATGSGTETKKNPWTFHDRLAGFRRGFKDVAGLLEPI